MNFTNLNPTVSRFVFIFIIIWIFIEPNYSQPDRWQQKVKYFMDINMNVKTNRFTGYQTLHYTNNSPDTLKKVFYHLYWNAFQPGSMMDEYGREIMKIKTNLNLFEDKVKDRILHLKPEEIGYQKVISLKMNGISQEYKIDETIMEVFLNKPILPYSSVTFSMSFEAQVPLLVRRGGRDSNEGVRYSMSQWYPKICEYDADGWHPTPYVLREFYGVWGHFDVRITIDKRYMLGGTGYLQNPNIIGFGYEKQGTKVERPSGDKLTWHFVADSVHDFMWAADTGYIHLIRQIPNGPILNVLYVNHDKNPSVDTSWNDLADAIKKEFPFIQKRFGHYPYKQISIIHGGDDGMEYPMACLISTPNIGQAFHEILHNWYYGLLASNESLYAWMDEGFTTFAYDLVWTKYLDDYVDTHPENARVKGIRDYFASLLPSEHGEQYQNYYKLVQSGLEEPLSTHADHFNTKVAYDIGNYGKGDVFLEQLGYIVGASVRDSILLEYYRLWQFKHPNSDDFIGIAEKISQMQLDWYKEYWINTTKTIDYSIDTVWEENASTKISLKMIGKIPMPLDIVIKYIDNTQDTIYIPQYLMFGEKLNENSDTKRSTLNPWKWTSPFYTFEIKHKLTDIKEIEIDPSQRMADINRENNKIEFISE